MKRIRTYLQSEKGGAVYLTDTRDIHERAIRILGEVKARDECKKAVKIDSTTTIFINPDRDPVEAKRTFLRRLEESSNNY